MSGFTWNTPFPESHPRFCNVEYLLTCKLCKTDRFEKRYALLIETKNGIYDITEDTTIDDTPFVICITCADILKIRYIKRLSHCYNRLNILSDKDSIKYEKKAYIDKSIDNLRKRIKE